MVSDPKEGPEPNSRTGSAAQNSADLKATDSRIENVSQVVNSPGAVVTQTHLTQITASPGLSRNDLIFWVFLVFTIVAVASRATINVGLPPMLSQLVAGGVLAAIVWKFFERVETVLTDGTKLEIAAWLSGIKAEHVEERWPETFAKTFDLLFGKAHFLFSCFWRSMVATVVSAALVCLLVGIDSFAAIGTTVITYIIPANILARRRNLWVTEGATGWFG